MLSRSKCPRAPGTLGSDSGQPFAEQVGHAASATASRTRTGSSRTGVVVTGGLLSERAQQVQVPPHDPLGRFHIRGEIGIGRGDANAVRRLDDVKRVAYAGPQPREQLFGQDDASGITDLGDFEGIVHSRVITRSEGSRKALGNLRLSHLLPLFCLLIIAIELKHLGLGYFEASRN